MTEKPESPAPDAEQPTISAYIQCYGNQRALYETLKSFRTYYPTEDVTLVSDKGDDYAGFAGYFDLHYYRAKRKANPYELGEDGAREYLRRIYEHCCRTSSDYVIILESDVTTLRPIRSFPETDCAGPRCNKFAEPMNDYLQEHNDTARDFCYVMCGGSIFKRHIYIECYEKQDLDLRRLAALDERIVIYSDVILTFLFLRGGYSSGIWSEVSETKHRLESFRIFRDAAFDHADKTWYGANFDESMLDHKPNWSAQALGDRR